MRQCCFFGPGEALFGVYESPSGTPRDLGILLVYPFGQEYIRAHRTFVALGAALAVEGFATFRFDLSGCGDSAGDTELHSLDRWQSDIDVAVSALRATAGLEQVAVVGLRLGATLALLWASRQAQRIRTLALWEPVLDGVAYLNELREDDEQYAEALGLERPQCSAENGDTSLGFKLSPRLRQELSCLDRDRLLAGVRKADAWAVFCRSEWRSVAGRLSRAETWTGRVVEVQGDAIWKKTADGQAALVPRKTIRTVTAWLASH